MVLKLVVVMILVIVLNVLIGVSYSIIMSILNISFCRFLMVCRMDLFVGFRFWIVKLISSVMSNICSMLFLVRVEGSDFGMICWMNLVILCDFVVWLVNVVLFLIVLGLRCRFLFGLSRLLMINLILSVIDDIVRK